MKTTVFVISTYWALATAKAQAKIAILIIVDAVSTINRTF